MIFDQIKLYLKNPETGELKITFLCENCGKEMDSPDYWMFRTYNFSQKEKPGYHFRCNKCVQKELEKEKERLEYQKNLYETLQ